MNQNQHGGVWQVIAGGRARSLARETEMQELVLIPPIPITRGELAREAESTAARREFEERLAECGSLAYRVARGVLRNAADAEDVAQEALLRAYRNFGRLREPQRFRGWLVRISFRLALDRARSAKRREQRESLWVQPERQIAPRTAEDLAASSEFQARLDRALDELPEKLRLVLMLSAMEGHGVEEVAAMLGVPAGTVKSRLFTARKKLAEKLQWNVSDTKRR
jgi:RNA polymerase sigma-70 factor (ECF subfamily)